MAEDKCSIEGCDRPRKFVATGWCGTHYARWKRAGDPLAPVRRYERAGPECSVDGCARKPKTRGMCGMHYQRWRDEGSPGPAAPTAYRKECSVEGCGRKHKSLGYCEPHLYRVRRYGDPRVDQPVQEKTPRPDECEVEGCHDEVSARRMCGSHYAQAKAGRPLTIGGKRVYGPRGAGHVNKDGYRVIGVGGRSRFEHQIIAEEALGRPLLRGEEIHHLNGDRLGNWTDGPFVLNERGNLASGNLEIWSTSQPKGQEVGPKVEWALDLLGLYREHLSVSQRERLAQLCQT